MPNVPRILLKRLDKEKFESEMKERFQSVIRRSVWNDVSSISLHGVQPINILWCTNY